MSKNVGFNTRAVHQGEVHIPEFGNVITPVFQESTFKYPNRGENPHIDTTTGKPFLYSRVGNPTVQALEEKYASLENSQYAASYSSGMAAITSTILSMGGRNKNILSLNELYGQTHVLFSDVLRNYGYKVDFLDIDNMNSIEFDPAGYSLVYTESIINPTLKVTDLVKISKFCQESNIPVVVDATFASPFNQNPIDLGCTVAVHSATKYISGHSDVTLGMVGTSNRQIYQEIVESRKNLGSSVDPFQAYLAMRGLKTLGLRVTRQNQNAMELSKFLEQHKKVKQVLYPGLEGSPYHEIATRNLKGYGGMLSFELLEGYAAATKLLRELEVAVAATSLGGIESLVSMPVDTSHVGISPEDRAAMGINDGLVRFSCGIEDPEDLIEDLQNALDKV